MDSWFEAGSMPFAQFHYPFENKQKFEAELPGRLHSRVHRPDSCLVLLHARRQASRFLVTNSLQERHNHRYACWQ